MDDVVTDERLLIALSHASSKVEEGIRTAVPECPTTHGFDLRPQHRSVYASEGQRLLLTLFLFPFVA